MQAGIFVSYSYLIPLESVNIADTEHQLTVTHWHLHLPCPAHFLYEPFLSFLTHSDFLVHLRHHILLEGVASSLHKSHSLH